MLQFRPWEKRCYCFLGGYFKTQRIFPETSLPRSISWKCRYIYFSSPSIFIIIMMAITPCSTNYTKLNCCIIQRKGEGFFFCNFLSSNLKNKAKAKRKRKCQCSWPSLCHGCFVLDKCIAKTSVSFHKFLALKSVTRRSRTT